MQKAFIKRDGGDTLIKLSYIAARWVYKHHRDVVDVNEVFKDESEKTFRNLHPNLREPLKYITLYSPLDPKEDPWFPAKDQLKPCYHDGIF